MHRFKRLMNHNGCWKIKKGNILFYNEIAEKYDLQYRKEQMKKYKAGLKTLCPLKESWMLDIGSGTGLLVEFIATDSNLISVDCSKNMIKQAKHKYGNKQDFVCADADNLPFRKQTFNNVFSFTLLQNMPNPEKTIVEMLRIAKQGSEIVLSVTKKAFNKMSFLDLFNGKKVGMVKLLDDKELKDYILVSKCYG